MERKLLSVPEACRALGGISRSALYKLVAEGKLQKTKLIGRTFFRDAEIERFTASL